MVASFFSRAELDAAVGHELSHRSKKHPWIQIPLIVVPLAVRGVDVDYLLTPHVIPGWYYGFIMAIAVTAGMGLVSRAHERSADAGGVSIADNPEAFITGVVKLARL